jgi:nicotinamidase/pyrazinamidase
MIKVSREDALIIVDVQRDFTKGGALEVPKGDDVVPVLNRYIELFRKVGAPVIASRDWHPSNHMSFKPYGGQWPPHCIQNTKGAEFHPELKLPDDAIIISKATEPDKEAYSAFEGTELLTTLHEKGIKRVFIGGLATEFCVKSTVLDAVKSGFRVFLLVDAIRGISDEKVKEAIKEMQERGVEVIALDDIVG